MTDPQHFNGSLFHGDITVYDHSLIVGGNLTVRGITDADLDTLTTRILADLHADAPVTSAGGPENTIILALDGRPPSAANLDF